MSVIFSLGNTPQINYFADFSLLMPFVETAEFFLQHWPASLMLQKSCSQEENPSLSKSKRKV